VGTVADPGALPAASPTTWFGPSFLLDESRLQPPPVARGSVPRVALLDRLAGALDATLVSVVAPPGYGKTALLSQWAARTGHRVAWLSLEPDDNDPAVLLACIASALGRVEPIDTDAFRTRVPPGTSVAAMVARRVAVTLGSMSHPVALMLDHAELLHNPQCRDAVAELAVRLPPGAQLVVASRGEPPVPTAALRARRMIVEVGTDDLAMDEAEARVLLTAAGVELDAGGVAELVAHTEGWPVGLYLAALAYRAGGRRATVGFTGDDRLMADYLRTVLLANVPRGRVEFLTRTSVLDRMSGPLCDAVLGTTRSGRLLQALESTDALLVPLDRRREWYRYHRLFRQLLRTELDQREAGVVHGLHERAAAWYEGNGQPEAAIGHAQAAGDVERVARLVASHALAAYAAGRVATVCRWLDWFEDRGVVDDHPTIGVLGGVVNGLIGRAAAAERWAAGAERSPVAGVPPDGSTMASWLAVLRMFMGRDGMDRMRRDAREALEGLAPASQWRASVHLFEGISWLFEGQPGRADPLLAHAIDVAMDLGAFPVAVVAIAERAIAALERDAGDEAAALVDHALDLVRVGGLEDYAPSAIVYAVGARTAAQHGDREAAVERLGRATRLRTQLTYAVPCFSVQALLELARADLALADAAGAQVVLREARDILRLRPGLGVLGERADELRTTLESVHVGAVGASALTTAELRLVPLLSTHLSFPEIGERLYVSRHTVKTQAISVYRKLGVSSRSEAIERLHAIGLLGT
jgi:LuxR family transcriptional regulator, maltose regulon positive regulatory protein